MACAGKTLSNPARTRAIISHPTEWATRPRSPEPHGVERPAPDSNRRCPSNARTGLQSKIGCAGGSLTRGKASRLPCHRSRRVTTEGSELRSARGRRLLGFRPAAVRLPTGCLLVLCLGGVFLAPLPNPCSQGNLGLFRHYVSGVVFAGSAGVPGTRVTEVWSDGDVPWFSKVCVG